jgi:GGDEF domain-containing protein
VLHRIGISFRKLARETGGIGGRQGTDTFMLYCPHQDDIEQLLKKYMAGVFDDEETADRVSLRFGVFADAQQEDDVEERFDCAKLAADRIKEDPDTICGYYE